MPKVAKVLTDKQIRSLANTPTLGLHSAGGVTGLALQVRSKVAASWVLRAMIDGRRRDIGLGSYPDVSLSEARQEAARLRKEIRGGINPIEKRKAERSAMRAQQITQVVSFREVARQFVEKKRGEYKGKNVIGRVKKLEGRLENYVYPVIGNLLPRDITLSHIRAVLNPIWDDKNETASRVRLLIEKVLDLAEVLELREGKNPARWRNNLDQIYRKPSDVSPVQNLAALAVAELPLFIARLRQEESHTARLLEFQILTACRPGEARSARWDQIDLQARLWTLPASATKSKRQHVVPLSDRLVTMLESLSRDNALIFPNSLGKELTDVAVNKIAKKLSPGITCHGFRSTFKDWARIHASHFQDEVSELQLAHVGSDATRAAYARDALLEERRKLIFEYEKYCGYHCEVSFLVPPKKMGN